VTIDTTTLPCGTYLAIVIHMPVQFDEDPAVGEIVRRTRSLIHDVVLPVEEENRSLRYATLIADVRTRGTVSALPVRGRAPTRPRIFS
jgi:hypothetical protein